MLGNLVQAARLLSLSDRMEEAYANLDAVLDFPASEYAETQLSIQQQAAREKASLLEGKLLGVRKNHVQVRFVRFVYGLGYVTAHACL